MEPAGLKRLLLQTLVVSLALSGAIGAVIVAIGSAGAVEGRILMTTLTLAGFSLTGLAASVCFGGRFAGVAAAGLVSSVAGLTIALLLIWLIDVDLFGDWLVARALGVSIVLSITFAHAALLLRLCGTQRNVDRVVAVTLASTGFIALMLVLLILGEWRTVLVFVRTIGVLSVVAVTGTVIAPIMRASSKTGPVSPP